MSKIISGIAAGFVAAYGVWGALHLQGEKRLPSTVTNPKWEVATFERNSKKERVAAEPIALNPLRAL